MENFCEKCCTKLAANSGWKLQLCHDTHRIQQEFKEAEDIRATIAAGSPFAYRREPIERPVADRKLQVTQAQKAVEAVAEEVKRAQEDLDAAMRKQQIKRYDLQVLLARHGDLDEDLGRDDDSELEKPTPVLLRRNPFRTPYQSPLVAQRCEQIRVLVAPQTLVSGRSAVDLCNLPRAVASTPSPEQTP